MKYLSTSALAKEREIDSKDLFNQLKNNGWIYKKDGAWTLTKEGKIAGGDTKYNPKFGDYVVWPVNLDINKKINKSDKINSSTIGKEFDISAQKINTLLAELGWIEKSNIGGWNVTKFGSKNGGIEMEAKNGSPYVIWDKSILKSKSFIDSVNVATGTNYEENNSSSQDKFTDIDEFRQKYEAKYRTQDGHRVRSRAEAMIDDYLYRNGIAHAYERRLPGIDEDVLSDFYILKGNVFIEFWGMEENEQYVERKKTKLEIYAREGFNLIEMNDNDIQSIDDILPRKLKKYGINIS
ncbi:MAG: glycerol kinase [Saprospiraceae bacterium]|nr:glycerol kinase [Saprospiraceae bacterium]